MQLPHPVEPPSTHPAPAEPRPVPPYRDAALVAALAFLLLLAWIVQGLVAGPGTGGGEAGDVRGLPAQDPFEGLVLTTGPTPAAGAEPRDNAPRAEPGSDGAGSEPWDAATGSPAAPLNPRALAAPQVLAGRVLALHEAYRVPVRGIYIPAAVTGETAWFERLIDLVRRTELNAVVIDFKDDSGLLVADTPFPAAEAVDAVRVRFRHAVEVLESLREEGIYTIARVVTFKDDRLATARPDLAIQLPGGRPWRDRKGTAWLNPYHPEAWAYNIAVAREAARLGFREVQFDYVRFPSDGPVDAAVYPVQDTREPSQVIGDFLRAARKALAPYNVAVSADVFGQVPSVQGDMGIGQRWEDLAWGIDYVSPMVYPSHYARRVYGLPDPDAAPYETVLATLRDALARMPASDPAVIRPWLQDFSLRHRYGPDEVRAQIQAVYDAGLDQWLLWNPAARYTEEALQPAPDGKQEDPSTP